MNESSQPSESTANHHQPPTTTNDHELVALEQPAGGAARTAQAKPGTGKRAVTAVVALSLALAATFAYGKWARHHSSNDLDATAEHDSSQPVAVDVVPVVRSTNTRVITLPGEARPFYETVLFARTSGYLKKWTADIGDSVKEGQVIANIETPELDDQLKAAEAKVDELKAEVKLSQAATDFAKITFDRWVTGTPDGVVSQQERDQKKADLDSSLAHVEASKADLALGQAEVNRLQTLEGFKNVTAPFSGIVTERKVDIGDLISAGSTSSTAPLFKIAQYDQLRVFVDVPQGVSSEMTVGMPVTVYLPENASHKYEGKVDRTAGAIDPVARTLKVEVLVSNPDLALLPGTFVQADFKTNRAQTPLKIPAAALTMRSSGPEAAVVSADGTVNFHKLSIAQDMGDYVEVGSGLTEGDNVALNISREVKDGNKVTIHTSDNAAPTATASAVAPVQEISAVKTQ